MRLNCIDIKKNNYKLEAAIAKPHFISDKMFIERLRNYLKDLPNYRLYKFHKYIILDIYFDKTGYNIDNGKYTTVTHHDKENNITSINFVDQSRIVNIWI